MAGKLRCLDTKHPSTKDRPKHLSYSYNDFDEFLRPNAIHTMYTFEKLAHKFRPQLQSIPDHPTDLQLAMKLQAPLFSFVTLFVGSANSFAPPPSSSFVCRATLSRYDTKGLQLSDSNRVAGTALHMNLIDRFVRVAKGNLNNVLNNLEAPEKIMNQAMVDMQNDLVKVRQSYADITATQRRLLSQKEEAEARARGWYARAQLALRKGRESLAKEALTRRQQELETIKDIQTQIDTQAPALDKLYEGMKALESKIVEAKAKKEQFIARAKTAESTQKVNDMLSGMTGKTSMDAFKRMEEKVEALEAAAESSVEMAALLPGTIEPDLEKEFLLLEGSASVDEELQRMKTNLLSASSLSRMDPVYDPAVDAELEKLKKEEVVIRIPVTNID